MVWSLVLYPDDAKQNPEVYVAEFEGVFVVKGPRTASIQGRLDYIGLYHSGPKGERHFRMAVEARVGTA